MRPIPTSLVEQHAAVRSAGGFLPVEGRSVVEVTGTDRAIWLHNLVTNVVATLHPGEGNYAFAINTQGRTVFDVHILVMEDRLWLDIDTRWVSLALAHLGKYQVVEDVAMKDVSDDWTRFQAAGPNTCRLVESLGLGHNFGVFPALQHVAHAFESHTIHLVRNDVGPLPVAEFYVPRQVSAAFRAQLVEQGGELGMRPIDDAVYEMIRIEVGHPSSVEDIDDQVIPPETLQAERGISYVKGCYLGQEVLERMRSRQSMARRLVGFEIAGDDLPPRQAPVFLDDKEIGRVTSAVASVAAGSILALGYAKTLLIKPGEIVSVATGDDQIAAAKIVDLPLAIWRETSH